MATRRTVSPRLSQPLNESAFTTHPPTPGAPATEATTSASARGSRPSTPTERSQQNPNDPPISPDPPPLATPVDVDRAGLRKGCSNDSSNWFPSCDGFNPVHVGPLVAVAKAHRSIASTSGRHTSGRDTIGRDDAGWCGTAPVGRCSLGTVISAALVHFGVRLLTQGDTDTATANADRILSLDRALRVDVESSVQTGHGPRPPVAGGERKPERRLVALATADLDLGGPLPAGIPRSIDVCAERRSRPVRWDWCCAGRYPTPRPGSCTASRAPFATTQPETLAQPARVGQPVPIVSTLPLFVGWSNHL